MKKFIFLTVIFFAFPLMAADVNDAPGAAPYEDKPSAEDIKHDKDSDECYSQAQKKLKASGKAARPIVSGTPDSPDPESEILDEFYSECMEKKGYNLEQESGEGE
jgi:hypothetical protein